MQIDRRGWKIFSSLFFLVIIFGEIFSSLTTTVSYSKGCLRFSTASWTGLKFYCITNFLKIDCRRLKSWLILLTASLATTKAGLKSNSQKEEFPVTMLVAETFRYTSKLLISLEFDIRWPGVRAKCCIHSSTNHLVRLLCHLLIIIMNSMINERLKETCMPLIFSGFSSTPENVFVYKIWVKFLMWLLKFWN